MTREVAIGAVRLSTELPRIVAAGRPAGPTFAVPPHAVGGPRPADALLPLVDRAEAMGADVTKLAATARDIEDLRTMLAVTLAARQRGIVTVAMGPAGTLARVLLPAAGSLFTYGHVGTPTAPGQLTVTELATLVHRFFSFASI